MKNRIIYVMGVAGSGKSTIGKLLAEKTGIPFFDGDDFHPEANIRKMRSGQALTDDDRKDWLLTLNKVARLEMERHGAIIACSALKRSYRELLSEGLLDDCIWVWLAGKMDLIGNRMKNREGHFMPPGLLDSQYAILEAPADSIEVDITKTPSAIVEFIIENLPAS